MLATAGLLLAGCASPNVNPPQPRANTGYVDFYLDAPAELSWEVERFDDRAQDYKDIFSKLEPPPGGILRLAFPPGHYRLRVTFLNRVVREPALVEVDVKDGAITPVQVALVDEGTGLVKTSEEQRTSTYKGRYGRNFKHSTSESAMYRLAAEPKPSVPYQVRERMPYVH